MSAAIQRAFAPLGLFATLLTSGAVVAAPANTTPADNCLAAPNTAAPPGHHWYYRTDRATQRKCWYVRAPGQPAQQATAPPRKSTAKSMDSTSAPSGPLPAAEAAPTPVNSADAADYARKSRCLRLRPQPAPRRTILRRRFNLQLWQPAQAPSQVNRHQMLGPQVARRCRILRRHQFLLQPC